MDEIDNLIQGSLPHHYLYVVEFADSVVKVGYTRNKRQRLASHKADGNRREARAERVAWSDAHLYEDAKRGERVLISGCNLWWSVAWGAEYFHAPFGDVVELLGEVNQALLLLACRWNDLMADDTSA